VRVEVGSFFNYKSSLIEHYIDIWTIHDLKHPKYTIYYDEKKERNRDFNRILEILTKTKKEENPYA